MQVHQLHRWDMSYTEAKQVQSSLARKVIMEGEDIAPHLIAGVDISTHGPQSMAQAAVVVLDYPSLKLVEVATSQAIPAIPYIPGLLSFRECPLILAACEKVVNIPDIMLVDGQGVAHPRRFGLASHLGLFLDIPTVGCAKSILCGQHGVLAEEAGAHADLIDNGELIGAALRTRAKVKPMYVSVGHKISLASALYWVTKACRGYRLPEPTRLAHLAAGGNLPVPPRYQPEIFH